MTLIEKLEKSKSFWFLLFSSFFFFLLRLPSLFEPIWFQDEGIYQTIGMTLHAGGKMYLDAWDNKPPLLFTIYAFLNGDQEIIKLFSLIFGVLSLILFFFLIKRIVGEKATFIATAFFSFVLATPLIQGNIANTENFMIFPIILGVLIFLIFIKDSRKKNLIFFSSLILGIAFLFKVLAIFDFLALLSFLFFFLFPRLNFNNIKPKLEIIFKSIAFFLLPLLIAGIFFLFRGSFREFSNALLLQNFSYISSNNQFLIPQGLLLLKLLFLLIALVLLYRFKNLFKKEYVFVLIWFFFSLYNVFFSQRPYHHYLILLLPSFSLLLGLLLESKKFKLFFSSIFAATLLIILFYFGPPKSLTYYANFFKFINGAKTLNSYRNYFGSSINRYYKIANYIKVNSRKGDKIIVWGDNPQIYSISERVPSIRFSVIYHILEYDHNFSIISKAVSKNKPKLVVIMPPEDREMVDYPFSLENYKLRIDIAGSEIYERIN